MTGDPLNRPRSTSFANAENWLALGIGAVVLLVGASRRSAVGTCLALSSSPRLYRGITGKWPPGLNGRLQFENTKTPLAGDGGVHVQEVVRLERPIADVYRFWRRLKMGQTHIHKYMPLLFERIERGEIDPSFMITHRIGLEDAPAMYRTFRDKKDSCIKVVMKPGESAAHDQHATSH